MPIDFSLTEEQRQLQALARRFAKEVILPVAREYDEKEEVPWPVIEKLHEVGLLNAIIPEEYGGMGLKMLDEVIVGEELAYACMGIYTIPMASDLGITPVLLAGTEEQKERFLRPLTEKPALAAFALSEPGNGSDAAALKTRAIRQGDHYVLNGTKMWITNGNLAHLAVIWAKDEGGEVLGFLVPTDTPGFQAREVKRKMSLRASVTSELVLEEVRVPESLRLPKALGLKAPLSCLTQARFGIAWGAMGALEAVYEEAVAFAKSRSTFGEPLAKKQLVQAKLAEMLAWHTEGLLLAWRLARLKDEGKLTPAQVSLAKRQNVWKALQAARMARDILGGSGITLEYHAIRHMLNLETVYTYEGTHDVHTLVLGREITGLNAF